MSEIVKWHVIVVHVDFEEIRLQSLHLETETCQSKTTQRAERRVAAAYFYGKLWQKLQINKHFLQQNEHFGIIKLPVVERASLQILPSVHADLYQPAKKNSKPFNRLFKPSNPTRESYETG